MLRSNVRINNDTSNKLKVHIQNIYDDLTIQYNNLIFNIEYRDKRKLSDVRCSFDKNSSNDLEMIDDIFKETIPNTFVEQSMDNEISFMNFIEEEKDLLVQRINNDIQGASDFYSGGMCQHPLEYEEEIKTLAPKLYEVILKSLTSESFKKRSKSFNSKFNSNEKLQALRTGNFIDINQKQQYFHSLTEEDQKLFEQIENIEARNLARRKLAINIIDLLIGFTANKLTPTHVNIGLNDFMGNKTYSSCEFSSYSNLSCHPDTSSKIIKSWKYLYNQDVLEDLRRNFNSESSMNCVIIDNYVKKFLVEKSSVRK